MTTARTKYLLQQNEEQAHKLAAAYAEIERLKKEAGGKTVTISEMQGHMHNYREKVALLEKELDRQRMLTKEGHRQVDIREKAFKEQSLLVEEYETTIRVLGALLAAKPRSRDWALSFNWGPERGKGFEIPITLSEAPALKKLERDVLAGLEAEAKA